MRSLSALCVRLRASGGMHGGSTSHPGRPSGRPARRALTLRKPLLCGTQQTYPQSPPRIAPLKDPDSVEEERPSKIASLPKEIAAGEA